MKAIILAAGRGSRMGDRTRDLPKCQAELAGRTLLDWQLSALRAAGIDQTVVACGYREETLRGNFTKVRNERWAETNMVRTLECARDHLRSEPCVVSYSDIAYHPDHARALAMSDGDIAITYDALWHDLWSARFSDPLDDAETFLQEDGRLMAIGGKTKDIREIQGQYMGLLRFSPVGWSVVERKLAELGSSADRLDMTSLLRLLLADGVRVDAVRTEGRWCEADNQEDLALYGKMIGNTGATRWTHDWRWEP
ncbi:MAG: phosphocholine cytidylyltransferase family protein [Fibrobacteres bacterium]|nr:phosphocholine cytidylyltransferase family protein [Fibrobacterota bacterium]